MLDIKLLRDDPEFVKKNIAKRHISAPIDQILSIDEEYRDQLTRLNDLQHERNVAAHNIARAKKNKQDATDIIQNVKSINDTIGDLEDRMKSLNETRESMLLSLPNLVDDSVPEGEDENDNVVVRKWGEPVTPDFELKSHVDLIEELEIGDFDRAAQVAGSRFYYLKRGLFRMSMALSAFALDVLDKKGFTIMETPFMLNRESIQGAVTLEDFEDVIYKIEGEDLYLIATAEHTLLAYHKNEIFHEDAFPKFYAGFSTNFRKEAGAHGKDQRGIFRVHQFEKVEQFIFSKPEDSWKYHEFLIRNAEELFQALKIPYRIVLLCTGDVGKVSAKTYDLEGWMPVQQAYRELVSGSNCLDFQARRLNIRYRTPDGNVFVHTLNSTAIAVQRTLAAIIENYQQPDGTILIPEVLRPYMNGQEIIGPPEKNVNDPSDDVQV